MSKKSGHVRFRLNCRGGIRSHTSGSPSAMHASVVVVGRRRSLSVVVHGRDVSIGCHRFSVDSLPCPCVPCIPASFSLAVASQPVFQVFEKSLVVKIIKEIGLCPVTNEPLSLDDLIDVQVSSTVPAVKPDAAGSIPQLLAALQSEYDANALEMYSLRKTLHETRQELSETLYQLDAATRVVARVVRERDEYRRLAEEGGGFGGAGSGKNENSQQKKNANAEPAKKKAKTGGGLPEQVRRVASCRVDVVGVGGDLCLPFARVLLCI